MVVDVLDCPACEGPASLSTCVLCLLHTSSLWEDLCEREMCVHICQGGLLSHVPMCPMCQRDLHTVFFFLMSQQDFS